MIGQPPFLLGNMPSGPRLRLRLCHVAATAAVVALTACGSDPNVTVTGKVTFHSRNVVSAGPSNGCAGKGEYADIIEGATVTVSADGDDLVTGTLGPGMSNNDFDGALACVYDFTIDNVPAGRGVYTVQLTNRPAVKVTETALTSIAIDVRES